MDASTFERRGFGTTAEPVSHEGASDEWWTPPHVFAALGVDFDLDPCAPPQPAAPWIPAAGRYTRADDGLLRPWRGRVWLNPPYGRDVGAWLQRLAAHGDGIALVFHRSSTAWYQKAIRSADAKLEIAGRLSFVAGAGNPAADGRRNENAGADSILLAFGRECADAVVYAPARGLPGVAYRNHKPSRTGQTVLWEMT